MTWHIVVRIGDGDTYWPNLSAEEPRIIVPLQRQGDPWLVGNNVRTLFEDKFLVRPQGIQSDLVNLAIATYTADLRIPREYSDDRWSRDLVVHLPVLDVATWEQSSRTLHGMLDFLTGDSWEFRFRPMAGPKSSPIKPKPLAADAVCLFSGGLDSLVGAIDLLNGGKKVALVGHHGAGLTNSFQRETLSVLNEKFPDQILPFMFYVQPPKNERTDQSGKKVKIVEGESTMRSRSILFFALGIAVTGMLKGPSILTAAENGLISLNVPLADSRMGSLSTRTTHPHFIARFQELLRDLKIKSEIAMPYRFQTKGEMVKAVADRSALEATVKLTMSCSHTEAGRWRGKAGQHCGYCVPCIIRHAATTAAGVDDSPYLMDVRTNPPSSETGTGRDLQAFRIALERSSQEKPHDAIFHVLSTGPLPPADINQYADVYRRGMEEVRCFLKSK
jgi:7-cyano-7-deazaguanine synthase in queuosine biosynthesis